MTLTPFQQHDRGCEKTFCPFCLHFYFYSRISETVVKRTKKQTKKPQKKHNQNQPLLLIFAKGSCLE